MANKNELIIDDGTLVYEIKNKAGQLLGEICFNPSDTNIVNRYKKFQQFFENIKEEDYPKTDEGFEKLQNDIVEQFDYLLRTDAKGKLFSICGAATPLPNGELFFESVANSVAALIEKEMGVRMKKMQSRVNKYTEKYHK